MANFLYNNVNIVAVTCAVPSYCQVIDEHLIASDRYCKNFVKQTGVKRRYISITEQTCVDLGVVALKNALEIANWDKDSLDIVIFDSQTPDYCGGTGNSTFIHHYLALPQTCSALDLNLGCSGFPYSLATASSLLQQENINRVAVLLGDTQWCNYKNVNEIISEKCFLMGEAVGVVLLEKQQSYCSKYSLFTNGHGYKHLLHVGTGFKNSWRKEDKYILPNGEIASNGNYMDGIEIALFTNTDVCDSINNYLTLNCTSVTDYDYVLLHQANLQLIKGITNKFNLPDDKVPLSIDKYANTSTASAVVTLCSEFGNNHQGLKHFLNSSFGIGLSWGISDLFINTDVIGEIETTDLVLEEHFLKKAKE